MVTRPHVPRQVGVGAVHVSAALATFVLIFVYEGVQGFVACRLLARLARGDTVIPHCH